MPKVIVTGGAGFIGSHLCDRLLTQAEHEVHVIDNFSTGRPANLKHLAGNPRLVVHEADLGRTDLGKVFAGAEHVYHLAALADIVPSIEQPAHYVKSNVDGTFAVLEAARRAKVGRLVYAASSSCYGIPDTYPTPETAPCRPQYPYALTKYLGEQAVLHWGQVYQLPVVSLRLFNVYGPRSRTHGTYGAMFGVFLAQKLAGDPYTVVGDGTQSRDFTYVSDVTAAFVAAAQSDLTDQVFNVGTGKPATVNRVIELLGGPKTHIPKRPGEPDCTCADTRLIDKKLGWKAEVTIEQGVAHMLQNIEYWKDAPVWTPQSISDATQSWFAHLGKAQRGSPS